MLDPQEPLAKRIYEASREHFKKEHRELVKARYVTKDMFTQLKNTLTKQQMIDILELSSGHTLIAQPSNSDLYYVFCPIYNSDGDKYYDYKSCFNIRQQVGHCFMCQKNKGYDIYDMVAKHLGHQYLTDSYHWIKERFL